MSPRSKDKRIHLEGVRQNNLKNIDVEFPFGELTVVTGLSGSGKSSLAFETLYAEGQRRYVESLSTYTRQFLEKMPRPEVDEVAHIPPSVALEQHNVVYNSRSTVGTQTEVMDFLRVLWAKLGQTYCVNCGTKVEKLDAPRMAGIGAQWLAGGKAAVLAPFFQKPKKQGQIQDLLTLVREQGFRRIAWWKNSEESRILDLDELETEDFPKLKLKDFQQDRLFIVVDRLKVREGKSANDQKRLQESIEEALKLGRGRVGLYRWASGEVKFFSTDFACSECGEKYSKPQPSLFSFNTPLGACPNCSGFGYTLDVDEALVVPEPHRTLKNEAIAPLSKPAYQSWQRALLRFAERHGISVGKRYVDLTKRQKDLLWYGHSKDTTFPGILGFFDALQSKKYKFYIRVFIRRYQSQTLCEVCQGHRFSQAALAVRFRGLTMADVLAYSIHDALNWVKELQLSRPERETGQEAMAQIENRLAFLDEVGVGYLTLNRLAKTLSGGEFQRINLATQLGNGLCGTLYVLDEPSIGLHAADTERMIRVLKRLRDHGNTLVVVEHDLDIMQAADWLIELGPQSGSRGGRLVAQGRAQDLKTDSNSLTGMYLKGLLEVGRVHAQRSLPREFLKLTGCEENNLKSLDVAFPFKRFVVVTGVSGSGKSTLVHHTLYPAVYQCFPQLHQKKKSLEQGRFERLYGAEKLDGVVLLDQKPIGKTSRSNPATYMKAWDEIRRIYANQMAAIRRGLSRQSFSFNVDSGRCPSCQGEGEITLDMHFMADVKLPCEECDGKRFKPEVLKVKYRGLNVHELLHTTVDDAYEHFRDNALLRRKLGLLREVGLGYLVLGQSATSLSGGESQRLKIASVLDAKPSNHMLYVFDEPTTGLHHEDIKRLLAVLQDLIDYGHTVLMVEHHLDVIAQADWVIDLGPTGGEKGGYLMAEGPPESLIKETDSATGQMLAKKGYFAGGKNSSEASSRSHTSSSSDSPEGSFYSDEDPALDEVK